MSLEQLDLFAECEQGDVVLFVGDHEVDAHCAHRAQAWLEEQGRPLSVRSVAAVYVSVHEYIEACCRQNVFG